MKLVCHISQAEAPAAAKLAWLRQEAITAAATGDLYYALDAGHHARRFQKETQNQTEEPKQN
jgi:hypothetical protein